MKKSILFVIDSLHCAGAEKSLTTLLSLLDYSTYSVDLQLFGYGGLLEELVPKEVNILKSLSYMNFLQLPLKKAFFSSLKGRNLKMLFSRIRYSLAIRIKDYRNKQKARVFWQSASSVIERNPKNYDIAISYAQGIPTFYVAEKVSARRKFAWVNANYRLEGKDRNFQKKLYDKYNKIIGVSDSAKQTFLETFPCYSSKLEVIYDINNPDLIAKLSCTEKGYEDYFDGIKILTIGRLSRLKGYDIALEACKKLKEKGLEFKWYVLGSGNLEEDIKHYINENNLEEYFILLGVKANPYPYIKKCDIYVQTSRTEGFGLAIAEARMLNIPVVTTRFDGVYNQMINEKNGIVVEMSSDAVADGVLRLVNDEKLRENIIKYLELEKKGNIEEIAKFYQLIE